MTDSKKLWMEMKKAQLNTDEAGVRAHMSKISSVPKPTSGFASLSKKELNKVVKKSIDVRTQARKKSKTS